MKEKACGPMPALDAAAAAASALRTRLHDAASSQLEPYGPHPSEPGTAVVGGLF